MNLSEVWRDIPGYEGRYAVSDQGRVKSLPRKVRGRSRSGTEFMHRVPERILKPGRMNKFGHVSVALGRNNSLCVHFLVMLAFEGPRPSRCDVAHNNGIGNDNRFDNLRYATRTGNNLDCARNKRCKISFTVVQRARENYRQRNRTPVMQFCKDNGVSWSWYYRIVNEEIRVHA